MLQQFKHALCCACIINNNERQRLNLNFIQMGFFLFVLLHPYRAATTTHARRRRDVCAAAAVVARRRSHSHSHGEDPKSCKRRKNCSSIPAIFLYTAMMNQSPALGREF